MASPFTAGVAALLWAANPALGPRDLERILIETAHVGSLDRSVERWVWAARAVDRALPTLVNIVSPENGASIPRGTTIEFRAFVQAAGRGSPIITWTSDRDGSIGSGAELRRTDLSAGTHAITVTARFSDGFVASDSVTIAITNDPPRVTIQSPDPGQTFAVSEVITFRGESFDANEVEHGFRLADSQVAWYLDRSEVPFARGHAASAALSGASPGMHTITFRGNDGELTGEASVTIELTADPSDLPPNVVITAPRHLASFNADTFDAARGQWFALVTLTGSAIDPEDGLLPDAQISWTDRVNDAVGSTPLGSGSTVTVRLYAPNVSEANTHEIRMTAYDSAGNIRSDTITITVSDSSRG